MVELAHIKEDVILKEVALNFGRNLQVSLKNTYEAEASTVSDIETRESQVALAESAVTAEKHELESLAKQSEERSEIASEYFVCLIIELSRFDTVYTFYIII